MIDSHLPSVGFNFTQGELPLLITVPHGIHLDQSHYPELEERVHGLKLEEQNIIETAQALLETFATCYGQRPSLLIALVHRSRLDFGRSPTTLRGESAYDDPRAANIFAAHETCIRKWIDAQPTEKPALLLDLHGCRTETYDLFIGTRHGQTCPSKYFHTLQTTLLNANWRVSPLPGQPETQFSARPDSIISRHNLAARSPLQASIQIEISGRVRNDEQRRQRLVNDLAKSIQIIFQSSP
jgi:hypothetical protein